MEGLLNWKEVFQFSRDSIIISNDKGIVTYINENAEKLLGWSAKRAIQSHVSSVIGVKKTVINMLIEQVLLTKERVACSADISNINFLRLGEDRKIRITIELSDFILENKSAGIIFFLKMHPLVKDNESIILDSLAQVWEFSQAVSELLQSLPTAFFLCKLVNKESIIVLDANQAAINFLNLDLKDILNRNLKELSYIFNDENLINDMHQLIMQKKPIEQESIEYGDNEEIIRAYNIKIFPIPRDRLGVLMEDITDLKKAEYILEKENIRLKEIDKLRKDFVMNATHELKTPLATIYGASRFIIQNFASLSKEKIKQFINHVDTGATRLKSLVENLLDFSRLDSGQIKLDLNEDDLIQVIKNVINCTEYLVMRRQQQMILKLPYELPIIMDKARIEQVLINLITNAVKNTHEGGKIEVSINDLNNEVQVEIKDNGIGLTSKELKTLFTKFGKIERENLDVDLDIQGSGLGLYISKQIIELHGGRIWAESKGRGKGSRFIFTIPKKITRKSSEH
ncbi:MAG: ATP-binding protein [Promethearchaeota archaeon]